MSGPAKTMIVSVLGLGLVAVGAALVVTPQMAAPEAEVTRNAAIRQEAPTAEFALNARYAGIYDDTIELVGGRYEGEPLEPGGASRPMVGLVESLQRVGDLDGDGREERVVLLWESSGGSGTSLYLATLGADRTGRAVFVGNRVQVRDLRIEGTRVVMEVLRAGIEDPMCCPGELATLAWTRNRGTLEVQQDDETGRLDLAAIAGDWRLVDGVEAPTDASGAAIADVTLRLGADGLVSGRSGCNSYNGSATLESPNELNVGEAATTLMACPEPIMGLERDYLARLAAVQRVGFRLGNLALTWQDEQDSGTLVFERVED